MAHAQPGPGELRGRVLDARNAVLPGVTVEVSSPALIGKRQSSQVLNMVWCCG